ncbi:hypothetical protein SCHPADRAFT_550686 [Schizopora paradoxa]|uniref:Uncharacterized protein n=1 Tax=Schizopora paradoxa TaxID=27342 RepID=A0A0H2RJV0_9AGAM|nr:hypothetical protein SCHPADRAFT_550686 [Schizopora paradoxa]
MYQPKQLFSEATKAEDEGDDCEMALTKQNACPTRRVHAKTTRFSNSVTLPPGTFGKSQSG